MNFDKFESIKNTFNNIKNVNFLSFMENAILIENIKTGDFFEIPFTEEKDKSCTYDVGKGKKVKEGKKDKSKTFKKDLKKINETSKKIFSNFDEGIKDFKELFSTLPFVEQKDVQPDKSLEKEYVKVSGLASKVSNAYKGYKESFIQFKNSVNIFDENDELTNNVINFTNISNMIKESTEKFKAFDFRLAKVLAFNEELFNQVKNKKLATAILESIDYSKDLNISIPKAIVVAQKKFGKEFNIAEMSRKLTKSYKTLFESDEIEKVEFSQPFNQFGDSDAVGTPDFLKFNSGKYSRPDLEKITQELEQSMIILPDLTYDDLMEIGTWKSIITYMHMTNTISDKKVTEVIDAFNKKYGGDNSDRYSDGDLDLGFKDISTQNDSKLDGFAQEDKTPDKGEDAFVGDLEHEFDKDRKIEPVEGAAI